MQNNLHFRDFNGISGFHGDFRGFQAKCTRFREVADTSTYTVCCTLYAGALKKTWTTYPEMHLKFLGLRWPLISTTPERPLLPLRSANTSSNLGNTSTYYKRSYTELSRRADVESGTSTFAIWQRTLSCHFQWDPLQHSVQSALCHCKTTR